MTDTTLQQQGADSCPQDALTAQIVSAYVSNNPVPQAELPDLIRQVRAEIGGGGAAVAPVVTRPALPTAQQIKKSITRDALISFEDGKPYKTLRRHLTTRGLTAEAYREKWGLPPDYPMVAESYSQHRASLAKELGLGSQRRKTA